MQLNFDHCLRHRDCQAALQKEGVICTECGKCSIGVIKKKADKLGYSLYIVPYVCFKKMQLNFDMTKGDAFLDKVSFLNDKAKESKCKVTILCIHQAIMPFCGSFGGEFDVNDLMVDNFSLIFCGHIHHKEGFGNFYQVGSLERSSMTEFVDYEENGKGYFIVEIGDGDVSVKDVDVILKRKFLHFLVSDFESIDSLEMSFYNLIETCDVAPVVCVCLLQKDAIKL